MTSKIAAVAAHDDAFGIAFKRSFMARCAYHLSFAAHWQHKEEHEEYAFNERYAYMNGGWVLLPPPPPPPPPADRSTIISGLTDFCTQCGDEMYDSDMLNPEPDPKLRLCRACKKGPVFTGRSYRLQ